MQHSEWVKPTTEEVRELEYTQLEENNGNGNGGGGKGNSNNSVPVNGGVCVVLLVVLIIGLWKQYRT